MSFRASASGGGGGPVTGDSSGARKEIRSEISHLNKRVDEDERRKQPQPCWLANKLARARRAPVAGRRGIVSGRVSGPVEC